MRKLFIYTLYCVCIVMGFISCDTNTPYYQYAHTPIDGWEKNDTLRYEVQPLKKGGEHQITVALRLNGAYPFRKLYLIMQQDIFPRLQSKTDTICFDYMDKDSIHITIRHAMKRDILPGISDIGVKLERIY